MSVSLAGYRHHKTKPQVLPLAVPLLTTVPAVLLGLTPHHELSDSAQGPWWSVCPLPQMFVTWPASLWYDQGTEGFCRPSVYSQPRNSFCIQTQQLLGDFCPFFTFFVPSPAKFEQTVGLGGNQTGDLSWEMLMNLSWKIIINLSTYFSKIIILPLPNLIDGENKKREGEKEE